MKWIGALCIILATTWSGFEASRLLRERTKQLRQLKMALQALEAEIMYGHTPLIDASLRLSQQLSKPLSWLFESFAQKLQKGTMNARQAWEESLHEIWKMTALKEGELEIMKQFGETLGQYDHEIQQNYIRLTMVHLEREEGDAIEKQQRYEKMMKSLGVLTGILIVLLLM
ncbi:MULTISPECIES: stage III sporulation protein SpoIIIAB [Anoxybacillus]|uniref:Stage III sporulation protein AB n=1 Tax=Anoxybacillus flavithermus TaxID=33934 RepID=A0A178THV4_9BACL|nr:stage III sporulation protein SpoIIIAB [Anoxybacillus flavithermus]ASA95515.1 stage III sporulation protein SpoAB [Anoxybacillus flavithermus]ELK22425.1 stage III sporulation protein AB [Anoxybacillus flavithermus TNO-09.006]MBE2904704.1 stage III sporulation protein SpoAB [Anoxybacillus flavithermus]MBE2907227.1 stage III sporulation protein SpoAB [Anoxybacillus flavithermus]MBE2909494.1 stage III sporulation protein SpoAB [Anoxybacillus flavithermus]